MRKTLAAMQLVIAAGIATFWSTYFGVGGAAFAGGVDERAFVTFESAFPVADSLLALALALSAWGNLHGRRFAGPLSLLAAGALVFLGLVDLSFNLAQGAFAAGLVQAVVNGSLNAACIAGGALTAWLATRAEDRSLRATPDWMWTGSGRRRRALNPGAPVGFSG